MPRGDDAKAALKRAVKTWGAIPGRWLRTRRPCSRILTYHSVGSRAHEMNVTPDDFRAQMRWLASCRKVVPLSDVLSSEDGVAITFDDGYRDNLLHAAPVLKELGLPATVFMVAGRAGGMLPHDFDASTSTLMTWDELRQWEALGFTTGAHTLTHARLSTLTEADQRREIAECQRLLSEHLAHPTKLFAYPYGSSLDYTKATVKLVQESGFSLAVTNRYGVNHPGSDPWRLRRIWVDATDRLETFQAKVAGHLDVLALLDSDCGIRGRRLLNRLLDTR